LIPSSWLPSLGRSVASGSGDRDRCIVLSPASASGHAKLSPSAAERWMTCPGSVVLSEGMPESESEYAAEGTRAHALSERWLLLHFAQHGSVLPAPTDLDAVEMAKHVKVYVDECIALAIKGAGVFVEKKVAVNSDVYGTADFIAWHPGTAALFVRDLKYGAGVAVSVERNVQLRIYALASLMTMKLPAKIVNIGIVQPRYDHPDGLIRSVDFDTADLLDLHADVLDAVERVSQAERAALLCNTTSAEKDRSWQGEFLKPSKKGCRWCLAAPKCPALKRKSQEIAKQVFAPGLAYEPLELARTLDFLPILEDWITNTREFAYQEAEKGKEIPDYKLVEKTAVRKWKSGVFANDLQEALGCKRSELWKPIELINIGDAVKLAPGKNAKERDAVLAPFVEKTSSGHTLVHVSDKRDPVRVDAKAAFADTATPAIAAGVSILD